MEERIGVFISNAFQNFGDTTTRGACNNNTLQTHIKQHAKDEHGVRHLDGFTRSSIGDDELLVVVAPGDLA